MVGGGGKVLDDFDFNFFFYFSAFQMNVSSSFYEKYEDFPAMTLRTISARADCGLAAG